jgi:ankyrin repeat protein
MEASIRGYDEVVNSLLNYGADVNAEDKEGKTVLMEAKNIPGNDAVIQLLEKGAKDSDSGLIKKLKGMHKNKETGAQNALLRKKTKEGR